jgi:hypothetical protein
MLWQLQAIHKTLRAIERELRAQRPVYFDLGAGGVIEYPHTIESPAELLEQWRLRPKGDIESEEE